MGKEKCISVIIPIFNVEKYIERCLDSVINQSYQNLQIICIDDGSTDRSGEICDEYSKLDARVQVIHKMNGGSSAARNAGLEVANGEYITFVDADDWLERDMYELLIEKANETTSGIDIVVCSYNFAFEDRIEPAYNCKDVPTHEMPVKQFLPYIYIRDDYRGVASYLWNKLFKNDVINGRGSVTRFDVSLGSLGDDILFAAECFMKAENIAYIPYCGYNYFQRKGATFQGAIASRLEKMCPLISYERIIELYIHNDVNSDTIDYIKRFYVYHGGLLLEYAIEKKYVEKIKVLKEKIILYYEVYVKTNSDYPDRIKWMDNLLDYS